MTQPKRMHIHLSTSSSTSSSNLVLLLLLFFIFIFFLPCNFCLRYGSWCRHGRMRVTAEWGKMVDEVEELWLVMHQESAGEKINKRRVVSKPRRRRRRGTLLHYKQDSRSKDMYKGRFVIYDFFFFFPPFIFSTERPHVTVGFLIPQAVRPLY